MKHPLTRFLATVVTWHVLLLGLAVSCDARAEEAATYRALASLPVHFTDQDEEPAARAERLQGIAEAIDGATDDRLVRAALVVLAWHETGLARYVHEGRCSDGPGGARECDSGRANGLWQLHHAPSWRVPDGDAAQAKVAARVWRGGRGSCRSMVTDELAGAFSAYGTGGKCAPSEWALKRAAHVRRLVGRL